jgi:GNAT superfamily N-acetyltransferase
MIRPGRSDDAETLLRIQRDAAVAAFGHIFPPERYPFPDARVHEIWEETLRDPEVEVYLAEQEGTAVGSVSIAGEFLQTLYVVTAAQSSGVGSALHDFALERLRERGFARAKLWVLEENRAARKFYERRGWSLTRETRVVPFPPNPIDVQYAREL